MSNVNRKLTSILAADCFGFSSLMEKNEEQTLENLKACRSIIDPYIEEFGGKINELTYSGSMKLRPPPGRQPNHRRSRSDVPVSVFGRSGFFTAGQKILKSPGKKTREIK